MSLSNGPIGSLPSDGCPQTPLTPIPRGSLVFAIPDGRFRWIAQDGADLAPLPGSLTDLAFSTLVSRDTDGAYFGAGLVTKGWTSTFADLLSLGISSSCAVDGGGFLYMSGASTLRKIDDTGSVLSSRAIPLELEGSSFGVSPDGATAYFGGHSGIYLDKLYALEVGGSAWVPIVTEADCHVSFGPRMITVLQNGHILVPWVNGVTKEQFIREYSAAGAILHTYILIPPELGPPPYAFYAALSPDLDPSAFWVSCYLTSGIVRVLNIQVSDGAILHSFARSLVDVPLDNAPFAVTKASTLELRQLHRPTSPGSTDLGPFSDQAIPLDGIAYINGTPTMPQLRARIDAPAAATSIDWSMEIVSERPDKRQDQDDIQTAVINLPANQTWAIDEALLAVPKLLAGFVGGKCTIHYRFKNAGGYLGPDNTSTFTIRGKNPLDATAKNYILGVQSPFRFLWAIIQSDSREFTATGPTGRVYNQFNATALPELPNWGKPDGWGMGQIDGTKGPPVPTSVVYNWKANVDRAREVLLAKRGAQQRFFDAVARTWGPVDPDARQLPPPTMVPGTTTVVTAMEAGMITLYNGAEDCPTMSLVDDQGKTKVFQNPWKFDSSTTPKWQLYPNTNNYLYKVIHNEWEPYGEIKE